MGRLRILFFSDQTESGSAVQLSVQILTAADVVLRRASTVRQFEAISAEDRFDVLILDILAGDRGLAGTPTEREVSDSQRFAGIDILRRCRTGHYGRRYLSVPILIRTACGESMIRRLCPCGVAVDFYRAGVEDGALVRAVTALSGYAALRSPAVGRLPDPFRSPESGYEGSQDA